MDANTNLTTTQLAEQWLTIAKLQEIADLGRETQSAYRKNGSLPYYKIGKRILYKASEINEWIEQHKVSA